MKPVMNARKITRSQARRDLNKKRLRGQRAGGDGSSFPLRVAKVTRVDSKRMVCALYVLTGEGDNYENVSLTQPAAGARHFLGGIPEIGDLCLVGYSPAESGYSRMPYINRWLIPGVDVGYDWIMTSATGEQEIVMTPALMEALQGSFGRRRHKLRQLDAGNIAGSSSQGADFLLNESVLLSNRRGNEIWLRDQDQALVVRSLQQFHAGAGFRMYGGMVQRDGTFLPTQMFTDYTDWYADKQIDSEGKPLSSDDLESSQQGLFNPNEVFSSGLAMGGTDPSDILRRGLYIDEEGRPYDGRLRSDAVYGGKPMFRVSIDPSQNGVVDSGAAVFTELRWEVAHTSDGRLPVTEQTDGVDIDRLLQNAPTTGVDGSGDPNSLNRSPNAAMVELVLGTAIGNDPVNERDRYGLPLVPQLYSPDGTFSPGLMAAGPDTPISEHAAFLVRVRNPVDPKAPDAFLAITKGGAMKSYFPGTSAGNAIEEAHAAGKRVSLGRDLRGVSQEVVGSGAFVYRGTGKGRLSDNVGLDFRSEGGAVSLFAGGAKSEGAGGDLYGNPQGSDSAQGFALLLQSAKSTLLSSVDTTKITGKKIQLNDAAVVDVAASAALNLVSGDTISGSTKKLNWTVSGKAEYTYGGPLDSNPTNGPLRTTAFTATPLTGGDGGVVDRYTIQFGGREEIFTLGDHLTHVKVGSWNIRTVSADASGGVSSGAKIATGPDGADTFLALETGNAELVANVGSVTMKATKGTATVKGQLGVTIESTANINIDGNFVQVSVPGGPAGGVLSDGVIDGLTGRTFLAAGTIGCPAFRVASS